MNRKMIFGFVVVCSLALNTAFVAMWVTHAGPRLMMHRSCDPSDAGCNACPLHQTLALSDSQWAVLQPRVAAYRNVADSLQREIAAARRALLDELARTPTDTSALRACRERILDGQRRMQEQVVLTVLEQKMTLTPEQQSRFIEAVRGMVCERGFGALGAGQPAYEKNKGSKLRCGMGHAEQ